MLAEWQAGLGGGGGALDFFYALWPGSQGIGLSSSSVVHNQGWWIGVGVGWISSPYWTFGDIWRHFWLSSLGRGAGRCCYRHPGRLPSVLQYTRQVPPPQKVIWPTISAAQRLRKLALVYWIVRAKDSFSLLLTSVSASVK